MNSTSRTPIHPVNINDDNAAMMDYARSPEGQAKINKALAELNAGKGILADAEYFENLKRRTHEAATKSETLIAELARSIR